MAFSPHSHSFSQFTFPACKACNERFSALESCTAPIMESLLEGGPVSSSELDVLLDWFDKVRIGLWLGNRMLGTNPFIVDEPKFHIDQRLGTADRALFITRHPNTIGQGLTFSGVGTPLFGSMPSVFGLRINHISFINISAAGILSHRLGLPYPIDKKIRTPDGVRYTGTLAFGTGRIKAPLIPFRYPARALKIYQPLYPFPLLPEVERLFRSEDVRKHFQDIPNLRGHIFTEANGKVTRLEAIEATEYAAMLAEPDPLFPELWSIASLQLQNIVSESSFWGGPPVDERMYLRRRKMMTSLRRLNDVWIKGTRRQFAELQKRRDARNVLRETSS